MRLVGGRDTPVVNSAEHGALAYRREPGMSMRCRENTRAGWRCGSAPLMRATAVERDDLAAGLGLGQALGKLLGDAEQLLSARHLGPDVFRSHARFDPEHDQIVA